MRGIPNLLIIKGGQVRKQIIGAVPKGRLVQAVDSAIASSSDHCSDKFIPGSGSHGLRPSE